MVTPKASKRGITVFIAIVLTNIARAWNTANSSVHFEPGRSLPETKTKNNPPFKTRIVSLGLFENFDSG